MYKQYKLRVQGSHILLVVLGQFELEFTIVGPQTS